jgi:trimethylamine--corrinoid protein Co-methyltransferase
MHIHATFLSPDQVQRIHEASLEILEQVGLLVRNEKARTRLAHHGCPVNPDSLIVKFPRAVVEEFLKAVPPKFKFYARDPNYDRTLPDDGPLMATASSAPNIVDPVTGQERRACSDDIARAAHLVMELPGIDVFSVSTLADDAPENQFSLSRFYPALKNCSKPVRTSVIDPREGEQILKLGALIAGSEAAYLERPFITFGHCAIVPPLTMDFDSTEMLMWYAERGLPHYGTVVPNAGLTSPLTLLGTLAQGNAEVLAQTTLTQMSRPGTPMVYQTLPTVGDMRTGAYSPGAIETGMLLMGFAQMATFYNVPCGGYVGLTNSKISDAQAGYEKGMSSVAALCGGLDYFVIGGLMDALMSLDFGQLVIDNEIALMLKRIARGYESGEESLALDLIAETGPGGMFIDKEHTLARMKKTAFLPDVADRNPRRAWEEKGGLTSHDRAMQRVRDILTRDNPAVFSPEVDARIRAKFAGLVAGEATLPEGWERVAPTRERRRERHRRAAPSQTI